MKASAEIDHAVLQLDRALQMYGWLRVETSGDAEVCQGPQSSFEPDPSSKPDQTPVGRAFTTDVALVLASARSALKWARGDAEEWRFAAMLVEISDNIERVAELAATGTIAE